MRKALCILIALLLPIGLFAQFQVGVTGLYASPLTPEAIGNFDLASISIDDFAFGGDVRFALGPLQLSALGLYSPEYYDSYWDEYNPASLLLLTDVGLKLDLWIFRLAAGIGPNFEFDFYDPSYPIESTDVFQLGGNIKLNADIVIGPVQFGLSYTILTNLNFADIVSSLENPYGYAGVSVLLTF